MSSPEPIELVRRECLDPQTDRITDVEAPQYAARERIADLQDRLVRSEMAYRHLEGAIASSRRIGAAVGVVMALSKITEDEAFAVLVKISQRQNRKLREVADDIVLTGTF